MRRMMCVVVLLCLLFVSGCVVTQSEDGEKEYGLDPNIAAKIQEGGTVTIGLLVLLAPFLGPAGAVAIGVIASGLAVFKKMKPKLETVQTKYELSNTIALIVVEAIEQLKKDHPKVWEEMAKKLLKQIEASGMDTELIKNAVRGLRGLPVKK